MTWYTRLYNWVSDRDAGIPITASRMDAEFDGIATALNSLHSAVTDSEWVLELNTPQYVSATQFKVLGIDLTATYHVGRRVKIIHNSGGTTSYGTITAVSFSTDTTVTVQLDPGSSLTSAVTTVYYGLLSYTNPSYLSPRTAAMMYKSAALQSYLTASGLVVVTCDGSVFDTRSELNASPLQWTAKETGYYFVQGSVTANMASSGLATACIVRAGSAEIQASMPCSTSIQHYPVAALMSVTKGDILKLGFYATVNGTIQNIGGSAYDTSLTVHRIP